MQESNSVSRTPSFVPIEVPLPLVSAYFILSTGVACLLCYGLTMWWEFADSTGTMCHVANFLPSFSSTIGNYTPQRYIWRLICGMSCTGRIFSVKLLHHHFRKVGYNPILNNIIAAMRLLEILGLFFLTIFASTEIFPLHATGFCLFFLFSCINVAIVSRILQSRRGLTPSGKPNNNVWWIPLLYYATFIGCFISYIVHNKLCWTGVYTIFGGLEVVMIACNFEFWYTCDVREWSAYTISIE